MYEAGALIAEGKTKKIFAVAGYPSEMVVMEAKDDITAGDGARHAIMPNKGFFSTKTTSNVFELLSTHGVSVAFRQQLSARQLLAYHCDMVPLEVVVRREAHGSFNKRYPGFAKGARFEVLIVEFFLKTTGKTFNGIELPWDDPLISWADNGESLILKNPHSPRSDEPTVPLAFDALGTGYRNRLEMQRIARRVFIYLEHAWRNLDCRLVDLKMEFGYDRHGNLLLADVIDNDSWRLFRGDMILDKQVFRDGGDVDEVAYRYALVASLSDRLAVS